MSIQFRKEAFQSGQELPLVVILDPRRDHIAGRNGLAHADTAGLISRCRAVVDHARKGEMTVAFLVADHPGACADDRSIWIKGLAPERADIILERKGASCYDNAYFAQMAVNGFVLAGFPADNEVAHTASDAMRAHHAPTILYDALREDKHASSPTGWLEFAVDVGDADIHVMGANHWMSGSTSKARAQPPQTGT
jgi:nicotinamidase-related amidase